VGVGGIGSSTMKNRVEVTTPAGDTTLIGALIAVNGMIATTVVAVGGDFGVVGTLPNRTSVTPARFVPVIVTIEPRNPLSGTNDVIVGRAIVGDGEGEGAGVGSTIGSVGNGRLGVGSAVWSVSDADGSASDGDGTSEVMVDAMADGDGRPPAALADGGATAPADGSPSCVSGEPLAVAGLNRSQPDRTSASTTRTAKRLPTRPRTG
jgi:hypothetical protein